MSRYFKWPTESGEAFAKVPDDYSYQYIIGATGACVVSIDRHDPGVAEIGESEWLEHNKEWRAVFGS